jgi:hypothetical protein
MQQAAANGTLFPDNAAQTAARHRTRPSARKHPCVNSPIAETAASANANTSMFALRASTAKHQAQEVAPLHAELAEQQPIAQAIQAVCGAEADAPRFAPASELTPNAPPTRTASGIANE